MTSSTRPRHALAPALGALLLLAGCRREEPPPPPPVAQEPARQPVPWTWHRLGALLVVSGEVDEPVDLVLRGRYMNDRMHAEFGPVRWELYAPPPGEVAELRTADGKLLAHWDFDAPVPAAPAPVQARKPKPAAPAQAKRAPAPELPTRPTPAPRPVPPPKVALKPTPAPRPAPKPAPKPKPVPMPIPKPTPAQAPRLAARKPSWPETHLPLFSGGSRKAPAKAAKAEPAAAKAVAAKKVLPVPPPAPAPLPKPATPPSKPIPVPPPPPPTTLSKDWPGAGEALNLIRGPRGSHWVCLTFDGGSTAEVALDVLDALKARTIRTTFFVTGSFIRRYPDLIRRMVQDGHEVGNHTLDHPHFAPGMKRDPRWTRERFQQQLLQADTAFLQLMGRPMDPYWRAPYGEHTAELRKWAEELGYRHVGWSEGADTLDWATVKERKLYRTGNAILDRLYDRMQKQDGDGLIVLMHLGSGRPEADRPARVLGPFLDQALDEGWNFVNISAYLKESGRAQWNSSNRLAMLAQTPPHQ